MAVCPIRARHDLDSSLDPRRDASPYHARSKALTIFSTNGLSGEDFSLSNPQHLNDLEITRQKIAEWYTMSVNTARHNRPAPRPTLSGSPRSSNNHLPSPVASLCFQSLTTIKFSKPFVLITIRNAGGCGWSPLPGPSRKTEHPKRMRVLSERSEPKDLSLTPLISDHVSSTLVRRIRRRRVRGFLSTVSTVNCRLSPRDSSVLPQPSTFELSALRLPSRISFRMNTFETPSQLFILKSLCEMLSPLECALTRKQGGGVFSVSH